MSLLRSEQQKGGLMGIGDRFGFGKKEPYRVPREIAVLRTRIEAEARENFPQLARFRELEQEAKQVYRLLNTVIAQKEYAEEASKISADIRKKLEALAARIRKSAHEAAVEASGGTMDLLAQKNLRDSAKTVFAAFLEGHQLFISTLKLNGPDSAGKLTTAASSMIKSLTILQNDYFSKHQSDEEIQWLRDHAREKVSELYTVVQQYKSAMSDHAVASIVEGHLDRILAAAVRRSAE